MAIDRGPVDPETARTMREIEAENSHRRLEVRYCSEPTPHTPKDCPDNVQGDWVTLRERWANDPDR